MASTSSRGWYSTFLIERDAESEFGRRAAHIDLLKALGAKVLIAAECTRTIHGTQVRAAIVAPDDERGRNGRISTRGLTKFADFLAEETA